VIYLLRAAVILVAIVVYAVVLAFLIIPKR